MLRVDRFFRKCNVACAGRICVGLILLLILGITSVAQARRELAANAAYCTQAENYAQQHASEALFFTAIPQHTNPARDYWKRAASSIALQTAEKNLDSTAAVTTRDGKVIFANFTFQNQFGDWVETAQYCFRLEGTLAQVHSELRSFHDGMKVIRDATFNEIGIELASTRNSFDLDTGKPAKLPPDFWDFPPPIFLHVSDLPFAKDLP